MSKQRPIDRGSQIRYKPASDPSREPAVGRSAYRAEFTPSFERELRGLDRGLNGRLTSELAAFWKEWAESTSDEELGRRLGFYPGGRVASSRVKRFRVLADYRVAYIELHDASPPTVLFLGIYDRKNQGAGIAAIERNLKERGLLRK